MKAILNNEIITLNPIDKKLLKQIHESKRILVDEVWYFNPDGATPAPNIPEKPGKYYKLENGVWVFDIAAVIDVLWQAATNYCETQINAAEYAKTLNLKDKSNVRAGENITWYDSVWEDYYNRCLAVQGGAVDFSTDFSNNGTKPWKFFEVVATV